MVRRNTRKLYSIVLLTGALVIAGPAQAKNFASFDCAKAATKVEKLICKHADLSTMDFELATVYHRLLAHAKDKQQIIASQRRWLRTQRNVCDNHDCLMQVYVDRVGELTGEYTAIMKKRQAKEDHSAAADSLSNTGPYHFTLTQGKGVSICRAYLKRLNAADYSTTPPYCNIPETTQVPGFTALHRVPLTAEQVHTLYQRVNLFMQIGKQGSKEEDEAENARLKRLGQLPSTESLVTIKKWLQQGVTKVWRYDPPIDIDNDGKPDNVVVWQGMPVSQLPGVCGQSYVYSRISYGPEQPQLVMIVTDNYDRLNAQKTKALSGYPGGHGRYHGVQLTQFRAIAGILGIFKFHKKYYLYGFGPTAKIVYNHGADGGTDIAVLLRQHGKTRQMCEYHMTGNEAGQHKN